MQILKRRSDAIYLTEMGAFIARRITAIPGGKKLIYNGVTMPLTAIADFAEKGKTDPLFKELALLVEETHGIWNEKAEKYLLAHFGVDIGEAAI